MGWIDRIKLYWLKLSAAGMCNSLAWKPIPEDVSHWELYWVYRKWVLPSHQWCRVKVDDPYVDSVHCSLVISTSARCLQFTSLRFNIISPKDQQYCMGPNKKWADSNPPYCEHFKLKVHWWLKSQGFWELPIYRVKGSFWTPFRSAQAGEGGKKLVRARTLACRVQWVCRWIGILGDAVFARRKWWRVLILLWVNNKPSPSHHHFYMWYKPFSIILPTSNRISTKTYCT